MPLSYDDTPTPADLRQYDDHQVVNMLNGERGKSAAFLREIIRLRKLVAKLSLTK